jgi:hypothetical protein
MINQIDSAKTKGRKNWYIDYISVPILLAALLLAGHYGLFFGETFLTNGDPVIFFDYQQRVIII